MNLPFNRKHRQKRNVTLIVLEAILQWLNLVFYVVPNALNVATACYFLADDWFYFGFARWTCWNTVSHMPSLALPGPPSEAGMLWSLAAPLQGNSVCMTVLACVLAASLHLYPCPTAALASAD